jgi:hypothetical protein
LPGLELKGADELRHVAAAMKKAGQTGLRLDLLKAIRDGVKPVVAEQKSTVRGLTGAPRAWKSDAAKLVRTSVRASGRAVGVRINVAGGVPGRYARHLNLGRWRHPVFGDPPWITQTVTPGWFDKPAQAAKTDLEQGLDKVLRQFIERLDRS